jgi:ribose transport system ATP-binding protein/rhamnose transport system ATP-binding protein
VHKRFGGTHAVRGVDITVPAGTVHALVGENGAGKSTVLGMLTGRVSADEGSVEIFGARLTGGDPRESRGQGLAAVYQELTLVPALSAAANVFLGDPITSRGLLGERAMRARFVELCRDFDITIAPDTPARDLSISQQQFVEIMRGVRADSRVLLLDEPSAALAEAERETLYRILDRLRSRGTTIVFVSHNLDEVLALSDGVTVLRDGEVIDSRRRADWTKESLIRAMVGRDVVLERRTDEPSLGDVSLAVRDVSLPGVLDIGELTARAGEIVGLWGLVGSGRTSFMRSVCGLEPRSSGRLELQGEPVPWPRSPRAAIGRGLVLVPESRKQALVMGMDAVHNHWIGRRSTGHGWLRPAAERAAAGEHGRFFGFRPERATDPVRALSGGNQQKVLLSKWTARDPAVLFVDEPTRGIDVGAKAEVLASLVRLARAGATIVVTSSELEEVLAVSDRLLVFAHGTVVREISCREEDVTVADIVRSGFGEGTAA